ncbi:MAG TPA: NADH-quinone oxidoreductase subunit NuoN [Cellvibrionaceae bacterium]
MTFTIQHVQALLPLIITCLTCVVVMLAIAWKRHHTFNTLVCLMGLNTALLSTYYAAKVIPIAVTPLFIVDGYSIFFTALILVSGLGSATLINTYIDSFKYNREEIYLLMVVATAGAIVLACAHHFAALFIGLELLSISLYGLVAYSFHRPRSLEAAIKYLVLSATASSILLFGIALLYSQFGSLAFSDIGPQLTSDAHPIVLVGLGMIVIGLGFKLSLAPFHVWTPDVYEGAPAPVGAFLATTAKVAVFAVVVRFLLIEAINSLLIPGIFILLAVIAVLSILVGNLLALRQTNIKRILGYSSIAHFGYLLVLVLTGGPKLGLEGFAAYLAIYVVTALAAFGVVTLMSKSGQDRDADHLHDLRGLFWRRPYLAAIMTVAMLSLGGVPITAGFIGKFYVIAASLTGGIWGYAMLAAVVAGSAIGIYFYLRCMVNLYLTKPGMHKFDSQPGWNQHTSGLMVLCSSLLIIYIGVFPETLMQLVQMAKVTGLH